MVVVVVVMVVMAELVVRGDADVLGQDVGQLAGGGPAAPAARGGGGGGRGGGGGGGGGGGAVDGSADPVLHADAPLPAGRDNAAAAVPLLAVSALLFIAVALSFALRARRGV